MAHVSVCWINFDLGRTCKVGVMLDNFQTTCHFVLIYDYVAVDMPGSSSHDLVWTYK